MSSSPGQLDSQQLEDLLATSLGGEWVTWSSDKASFARAAAQLSEGKHGRLMVSGLLILDEAVTTDRLKSIPIRAIEDAANRARSAGMAKVDDLPPLTREGRSAEDFSRLVAEHYQRQAAFVAHPVAAMAAAAGVKSPTVHTWVREARLRGFLPPASRKKG